MGGIVGLHQWPVASNSIKAHVENMCASIVHRGPDDMESQIGSTVGGDGAIFSIRRELFRPLLPESINDLVIPLQIVARGHRAIFEADAVGFEPLSGSFLREFRRKRRIVNRSWAALFGGKIGVSLWTPGQFTWQVWSHKILR